MSAMYKFEVQHTPLSWPQLTSSTTMSSQKAAMAGSTFMCGLQEPRNFGVQVVQHAAAQVAWHGIKLSGHSSRALPATFLHAHRFYNCRLRGREEWVEANMSERNQGLASSTVWCAAAVRPAAAGVVAAAADGCD
jgi:hypothetical protein